MGNVLKATGIAYSHRPDMPVLADVNLEVSAGESVAIMGRSGSGKSTLLQCLAGLLLPDRGSVTVSGRNLVRLTPKERASLRLKSMGFVMQFGELIPELTVRENIALPLHLQAVGKNPALKLVDDRAEELGIGHLLDRFVWEVSGGEMQRAAIARATVHGPEIVFADEPTGALDAQASESVIDLVTGLARRGMAVVVATHDDQVARRCDRTLCVESGGLRPLALGLS